MADVKRCDRCGAYYDKKDVDGVSFRCEESKFDMFGNESFINIDLCRKCSDELEIFMIGVNNE